MGRGVIGLTADTVPVRVVEVVETGTTTLEERTQPYQILRVHLLEGPYAGRQVLIDYGQRQVRPPGLVLHPGDRVLVTVGTDPDGNLTAYFTDYISLGVLDDLVATQASAVFELRGANPGWQLSTLYPAALLPLRRILCLPREPGVCNRRDRPDPRRITGIDHLGAHNNHAGLPARTLRPPAEPAAPLLRAGDDSGRGSPPVAGYGCSTAGWVDLAASRAISSSMAVVRDLGRSMGCPNARAQTALALTPSARPTPNITV